MYPDRGLSDSGLLLHYVPIYKFAVTYALSEFLRCSPYGQHILTSRYGMVGVGLYHLHLKTMTRV